MLCVCIVSVIMHLVCIIKTVTFMSLCIGTASVAMCLWVCIVIVNKWYCVFIIIVSINTMLFVYYFFHIWWLSLFIVRKSIFYVFKYYNWKSCTSSSEKAFCVIIIIVCVSWNTFESSVDITTQAQKLMQ